MKRLILFDNITEDKQLSIFKSKVVFIEIFQKDAQELESKYLSICFQISIHLTEQFGHNYSVSDVIFINYNSIYNKRKVVERVDKNNNAVFFFEKKHYSFMNKEELYNLIQETIIYWKPQIPNLK